MKKLFAFVGAAVLLLFLFYIGSIQERAKSSSARGLLAGIYSAQKAYHKEFGTYSAELGEVGFVPGDERVGLNSNCASPPPPNPYNQYFARLPCPTKNSFVAMAIVETEQKIKLTFIDQSGEISESQTTDPETALKLLETKFPPKHD